MTLPWGRISRPPTSLKLGLKVCDSFSGRDCLNNLTMDVLSHKSKRASSPGEEWEKWMEWDPTTAQSRLDQQPTPPSDLAGEDARIISSRGSSFSNASVQSNKKRKVSAESTNITASTAASPVGKLTSVQNRSHSIVEKRYRANLNDKIAELRDSIPTLREEKQSPTEIGASSSAVKHNKATVLSKAIEYIRLLEKRNAYLEEANEALRSYVRQASKAADQTEDKAKDEPNESWNVSPQDSPNESQGRPTESDAPRGLIPVPEEIRRLRDVPPQPHYADQAPFTSRVEPSTFGIVTTRGGRIFGKLMLGSVAGLMVVDRLAGSSSEQRHDHGLFALPLSSSAPALRPQWTVQNHIVTLPCSNLLLPFIRGFLLFGVLGLLLFLYLFNSKPKLGNSPATRTRGSTSPPSASPIEVRRNAWLTSIQTVWVPRHSMLPEMLALITETLAYVTRQILGWRSYSWLTGRSEEEETARVRAWEIALDAQLTGGDAELNKSRLVLTLWASGTLPKSPARLMLKALHIRVMFWQASDWTWICRALNSAASHLARYQWNSAQKMYDMTEKYKRNEDQDLPEHLMILLQRPIEDVMSDINVQRAHNLAWNRPVSGDNQGDTELDNMVDDTAMRGPLDILALWLSTRVLQQALSEHIQSDRSSDACLSQIDFARRAAPPGSNTSIQALTARTVLSEHDRESNVIELAHFVPPSASTLRLTSLANLHTYSTALHSNTLVAIKCAKALVTVTSCERGPDTLYNALVLLGETFYNFKSMDLLAFAAALQLVSVLLRDPDLASQHLRTLKEILSNTIIQKDEPTKHNKIYKVALRKALNLGIIKRRASAASVDTGYGSMSDEERLS